MWDERRTTVDAHRILSDNGVHGKKRKNTVDAVAASLILEGYLASPPPEPVGVDLRSTRAAKRPNGNHAKTCCFLRARWTKIRAVKCARGVTNQLTG